MGRKRSPVRIRPPRLSGSRRPRRRRGARARLPRPRPADPAGDAGADDRRLVAARLPGRARRPPPDHAHLPRLRRPRAHRAVSSRTATPRPRSSPSSAVCTPPSFPIRRMEPVDRYGGDDFRSIEADNTSAFNCRAATGLEPLVEPRLRAGDRRQPDREPLRHRRHELAPRERAVPRPLAAPGRHGVRRAASSSRRSAPPGGAGAAAGRAASATTSTSPATADRVARVLTGALAASVTPLRDGGAALDEDGFGPVVDFLAAGGLDGLLALGTNGEGILLSVAERRRVTELFVEAPRGPSPGRRPLRRAVDRRHGRTRGARGRGRRRRGRRDRAAVLPARRRCAARALRRRGRAPARRSRSTSTSSRSRAATQSRRTSCSIASASRRRTSPG